MRRFAAVSGSRRVAFSIIGTAVWWANAGREAKLRLIMERWDDAEKAARVLGCSPHQARYWWGNISR